MQVFRKSLLFLLSLVFTHHAFSQAPNISYSPASNTLTAGVSFSISSANSGGAVPATTYGQVTTFAGSTTAATGYVNATGTSARFNWPETIVGDASGNLYVADANNNAIRMVTSSGVVSTFAGSATGASGYTDAMGTSARFSGPDGLAFDASGNLYVSDYDNNAIRKITSAGVVSTFYHSSSTFGPSGMCFDASGNLIVVAQDLNQILKITSAGVVTTIAGSSYGYVNGTGTSAKFANPSDVKIDASGNLFVADYLNNAIRKITSAGVVTTFAGSSVSGNTGAFADGIGTAAKFNNATSISVGPGGALYVADFLNNGIRRIMPDGTVSLIAGSTTQGSGNTDGTGPAARFNQPDYLYVDGTGTGYVIELIGSRVRKMTLTGYTLNGTLPPGLAFDPTTGTISGTSSGPFAALTDTITAYNGSGYSVTTITLSGIAAPAPIITYNTGIDTLASGVPYTLNPANSGGAVPATAYGQVSTAAGSTTTTSGYVNASGTAARFNSPNAAAGDALGNIYIADGSNNAIRVLTQAGVVTTFAGSSTGASGYTDATGTSALFNNPAGIAIDASGNLFVADYGNNAIRKITPAHVVTTFYHSTGTFGPRGLLLDATGNVIVAAKDLNQILKITPAGVVTTIAGSSAGYVNATGASAQFSGPMDVKMDASGNLFVADYLNNAIRKIDPSGLVSTFAGSNVNGNTGSYADGVGTAARFNNPAGLAIAPGGIVYVADLLNNVVRRIMPDGTVSLAAGSATQAAGNTDGSGSAASFNQPNYVYIDNSGTGYVTELIGNRVRKIPFTGYSLNGALQSGLTFSSTTGIISGTVTGTITPVVVAVTAYNTGGFFLVATVPIGAPSIDWTGFTNTDWNTGSNWNTGTVPGSGDNARIGVKAYTGAAAQPLLGTNATVTNVTFGTNNSPILTISSGTLTVTKGFSVITGSTVTINGPGTLAFSGSSTISGSSTLRADANLIMSLGAASFLTNNGAFTLGSGPNGCASIAAIPSSSAVNGASPVSVERYLSGNAPAYRGYRLMSSPVYATTIGGNNVYSINYLLLSTYVTGDNASGGFSQYGNPSLYLFRENLIPGYSSFTDSGYRGFNDLSGSPTYSFDVDGGPYNIPAANGYLLFFRGGFSTSAPYTPGSTPAPAVVTATGQLNQGTITFKDWFTPGSSNLSYTSGYPNQGLNLIGNPYPSSIDWDQFSSTDNTKGIYGPSIKTIIQVYNPVTQSYGTYDAMTHAYTNGGSHIIESGQGFFVQANNASATLIFNEWAKIPDQLISGSSSLLSRSAPKLENMQYLRLEMNLDTIHYEDILVWFNSSAKTSFDPNTDGLYRLGFNKVSLSSLSSDHVRLGINQQPLPGFKQTATGLNVSATESGTYHFNLRQLVGLSKLYDVWLMDAYKKDSINLRINSKYDFAINKSDSTSFGDKRFSLIIRQNPAYAYQLLSFTANKVQTARQVEVIWKTQNEENYTNFTVERSTDGGRTFDVLGGVKAASQGQYSFPDKNPVIGLNLYRLKQEDINNAIFYSKIVPIQYANQGDQIASNKLTIYPNPAGSTINLAIAAETTEPTTYKIRFMNAMGTVVKEITSSQTSWQGNISNLQPGTYLVRVINDKTQSLVAENKFVRL